MKRATILRAEHAGGPAARLAALAAEWDALCWSIRADFLRAFYGGTEREIALSYIGAAANGA